MRFGIMAMQLEALVPAGIPAEQVMAGIMSFSHAGLAKSLFDQGFNPIELGGDLGMFLPQAYSVEAIQKLADLKAGGVTYTLHLPLWSVEPSTPLHARPQRLGGGGGADHSADACHWNRRCMCCMPPAHWRRNSTI